MSQFHLPCPCSQQHPNTHASVRMHANTHKNTSRRHCSLLLYRRERRRSRCCRRSAATARYESRKDRTGQVPSCCQTWRRSRSRAQDAGHRTVVARRRMKAPPSVQYWTVVVTVIGGISGSAAGRRRTASLCCRERDLMPAVLVVDECASRSEGIAGGGVGRHREGGCGCRQGRAIDDL